MGRVSFLPPDQQYQSTEGVILSPEKQKYQNTPGKTGVIHTLQEVSKSQVSTEAISRGYTLTEAKQDLSSSRDGRPFGHSKHGLKIGGATPLLGELGPI